MIIELRKLIVTYLLSLTIKICPNGEFKKELCLFLTKNILKL